MIYSKGISWINDCRIPFVDESDKDNFNYNSEGINRQKTSEAIFSNIKIIGKHNLDDKRQQGRFTPNLLVCDDILNDGNIVQYNKTRKDNGSYSKYYNLDLWFDKMLDRL